MIFFRTTSFCCSKLIFATQNSLFLCVKWIWHAHKSVFVWCEIHLEEAENWFYSKKTVLGSKFILEAKTDFVLAKLQGNFAQNCLVGSRPCHFKTINWFSQKAWKVLKTMQNSESIFKGRKTSFCCSKLIFATQNSFFLRVKWIWHAHKSVFV